MRRIARDNRAAERVRGRTATSVRVRLRALLARLDERPSAEIHTVSRKSYRELFHFSKGVLKGMKGVCITLESDRVLAVCTAATSTGFAALVRRRRAHPGHRGKVVTPVTAQMDGNSGGGSGIEHREQLLVGYFRLGAGWSSREGSAGSASACTGRAEACRVDDDDADLLHVGESVHKGLVHEAVFLHNLFHLKYTQGR